MKRYRCPYCGEECISRFRKGYGFGQHYKNFKGTNSDLSYLFSYVKNGYLCPECKRYFVTTVNYGIRSKIIWLIILIPMAIMLLLAIDTLDFRIAIAAVAYFILIKFLILPIFLIATPFVLYDENAKKKIDLIPDAVLSLKKNSKSLKKMRIYGVKPKTPVTVGRFNVFHKDGLIPCRICEEFEKDEYRVTLMDIKLLPESFYSEFSEIEVIDNKKIIATGKIFGIAVKESKITGS